MLRPCHLTFSDFTIIKMYNLFTINATIFMKKMCIVVFNFTGTLTGLEWLQYIEMLIKLKFVMVFFRIL